MSVRGRFQFLQPSLQVEPSGLWETLVLTNPDIARVMESAFQISAIDGYTTYVALRRIFTGASLSPSV